VGDRPVGDRELGDRVVAGVDHEVGVAAELVGGIVGPARRDCARLATARDDPLGESRRLGGAEVAGGELDLAMQVRQLDDVVVGDRELETGGAERQRDRAAEPARATRGSRPSSPYHATGAADHQRAPFGHISIIGLGDAAIAGGSADATARPHTLHRHCTDHPTAPSGQLARSSPPA
jgi:hypothetical protein